VSTNLLKGLDDEDLLPCRLRKQVSPKCQLSAKVDSIVFQNAIMSVMSF
jgi:hypothetical protein